MAQYTRVSTQPRSYDKAPVLLRLSAAAIDSAIAGLPWFILAPLWSVTPFRLPTQFGLLQGFIVGAALLWTFCYICFRDSFNAGQSIGKRCLGLMVVGTLSCQPCNTMQSFLRNVLLWLDIGWIIEGIFTLLNLKTGRRIGDYFALTQVIQVSHYNRRVR